MHINHNGQREWRMDVFVCWDQAVRVSCSYRPALTAVLFFLASSQPLAQEEASALGWGAGGGTARPRCILVAGRRDLNGWKLQVLLTPRTLKLFLLQLLLLAHDVLHPAHFKALAPQRGARRAGQGQIHHASITLPICRALDLQHGQLEGFWHGSASAQSYMSKYRCRSKSSASPHLGWAKFSTSCEKVHCWHVGTYRRFPLKNLLSRKPA